MLIGELAEATASTTKTLRYYEEEGLLAPPERTPGGYRDYSPEAVERVTFIRHAQASGLTLGQIREVLDVRDGGVAPCAHVSLFVEHRIAEVDARLRDLKHTRRQLAALRARLHELDPEQCDADVVCSAIRFAGADV